MKTTFIDSMERRILLAAGLPDYSFGKVGQVVTTAGGATNALRVAMQRDGDIVVLAALKKGQALLRFQPGGAVDTTFGATGIVKLDASSFVDVIADLQGNIVVAGQKLIERFDSLGKLDAGFGDGGKVKTASNVTALAVRSDGRIIAGSDDGIIRQYRANGTPDRTFGTDGHGGISLESVSGVRQVSAVDLQRQRDGKIIVLASANRTEPDTIFFRLTTDLKLDRTFAKGNGFVSVDLGTDEPQSLAIGPNDKIAASEFTNIDSDVIQLDADGAFDGTFGDAGIVNVSRLGLDRTYGQMRLPIVVDKSGRIIVGSGSQNPIGGALLFGFVRLASNGMLDKTFAYDGRSEFGFEPFGVDHLTDMALTPAGNIIAVGGDDAVKIAQLQNEGVDPPFAEITSRTLRINGTPRDDFIEVDREHFDNVDTVDVFFDREHMTFPPGQISRVLIDGGAGDDSISSVSFKPTTIMGGAGNDSINISQFSSNVDANQHSTLMGGLGDDTIVGDVRNNTIDGGAGNDSLVGGGGDDLLNGGEGDDTLIADEKALGRKHAEADQVYGGPGRDSALLDSLDTANSIEVLLKPPTNQP